MFPRTGIKLINIIVDELRQLTQANVNADELMEELRKESLQEQRKMEKAEAIIRKKIEKLEHRKSAAEDKWLDGDWTKDRYYEVIERLDIELSDERQKLHRLLKENVTRETLKLPDISKFLKLDEFDRTGKCCKVSYNFMV